MVTPPPSAQRQGPPLHAVCGGGPVAASLTCTTLLCSLHLHLHFRKFPVGALDQEAPGSWAPGPLPP